jgi:hypothetical protein
MTMRLSRKRLLMAAGGITAVGAAATLVAGVTFGLFSAKATQAPGNTFTAGTVTLAINQPASASCAIGPMEAGDQSTGFTPANPAENPAATDAPCTFAVNYSGTLGAFIGVGLAVTPATGGLYDGTGTGLQFQISDGTHSYTTNGLINTNSSTSPLYVSTDPGGTTTTPHTFTVNYALPQGATNAYQGLSTTLTITVYAVQASNNGTATGCTVGSACASITAWS